MPIWRDDTAPEYEEVGNYHTSIDNHILRIFYSEKKLKGWASPMEKGWDWTFDGSVFSLKGRLVGNISAEDAKKQALQAVKEILIKGLDSIERAEKGIPLGEIVRGED